MRSHPVCHIHDITMFAQWRIQGGPWSAMEPPPFARDFMYRIHGKVHGVFIFTLFRESLSIREKNVRLCS